MSALDPSVLRAAFARAIDRLPLPVKSSPGFLVNRILMPYLLEAVELVEEGIPAILVDEAALDRFLDRVPEQVVVVIDEAYRELLPPALQPDTVKYIRAGRPVFLLRTFSKAYGLAGLRIEPPPSFAWATGTTPAATSAAEPPEEPPEEKPRFQGLWVRP